MNRLQLGSRLVGEVEKSIANAAKSGQTMVLVSHDMSFVAQVADKVLFLDKGRIIESGTPEEIMQHPKEERTKESLLVTNGPMFDIIEER